MFRRGFGRRLVTRASRRLGLRWFRFYACAVGSSDSFSARPGVETRVLSSEEALACCSEEGLDLRPDMVVGAYSRGDVCFGAYEAETLVGYCWLASASLHHLDDVWVQFGPSVAWVYKSFVRPSHRGRGIVAALYGFTDRQASEWGRSISVICVESHNASSIAAALRAGYRASGRAGYLRRGERLIDWYSQWVRGHGISFYIPNVA